MIRVHLHLCIQNIFHVLTAKGSRHLPYITDTPIYRSASLAASVSPDLSPLLLPTYEYTLLHSSAAPNNTPFPHLVSSYSPLLQNSAPHPILCPYSKGLSLSQLRRLVSMTVAMPFGIFRVRKIETMCLVSLATSLHLMETSHKHHHEIFLQSRPFDAKMVRFQPAVHVIAVKDFSYSSTSRKVRQRQLAIKRKS